MLTCKFDCHTCGLQDEKVFVKERMESEDIEDWMGYVRAAAEDIHKLLYPKCPSKVVDIKVPLFEDMRWVGDKGKIEMTEESKIALGEMLGVLRKVRGAHDETAYLDKG